MYGVIMTTGRCPGLFPSALSGRKYSNNNSHAQTCSQRDETINKTQYNTATAAIHSL